MNLKGRPRANTAKEIFFSTIDANSRDSSDGTSCTAAAAGDATDLTANRLVDLGLYLMPQLFFACLLPANLSNACRRMF